jgi:hypothetical protein
MEKFNLLIKLPQLSWAKAFPCHCIFLKLCSENSMDSAANASNKKVIISRTSTNPNTPGLSEEVTTAARIFESDNFLRRVETWSKLKNGLLMIK